MIFLCDYVRAVFHILERDLPQEARPVYDYFASTYIFRADRHGGRDRPPRFEISTWNQHQTVLDRKQRTNNGQVLFYYLKLYNFLNFYI